MQNFNFLMPLKGTATKTFEWKDDEWNLKKNYQAGKFFKGFEIPVKNLREAYSILEENQEWPVFNITGSIIEGTNKSKMIRRKRTDNNDRLKPTITDRNLSLFCLDIDGYDGTIEDIIEELPVPFHSCDYIYQHSSSHGLTSDQLKCHLFFWLKEPVHNLDIREWIKEYNRKKGWKNIIDPSVLTCTQPIYIQKRICIGKSDPVANFIGYAEKSGELFWKPELINKRKTKSPKIQSDYDLTEGIKRILTAENYHEELNGLALSLINKKVPPYTVKQLLEGAMNSAGIKDKRWKDRFEDIGRAVNSAADIVNNPSLEDVMDWLSESTPTQIKADFADKCILLSPMDRTVAILDISTRIGFGVADIKKTIKIAEEEHTEESRIAAIEARSIERETRGIYEIECNSSNNGVCALRACNILATTEKKPELYVMAGSLVSMGLGVPKTIRQCSKLAEMGEDYPKIPVVLPYKKPFYGLAGRIEQDVIFVNEKGADIECPIKILHMIGDATNNNFKSLTGIVEHPFIDNKWDLIQTEGYNKETGLFTLLHHKLKVKKMKPERAYKYLTEIVFDEFPFSTKLDRAVAVAAMMTAIQRPTIAGDSGMPGFGIVSPVQSSGKTTLAQLISYSIYNRPVAASSWSDDEEELGKHILAILQEGHSCVLFDNIPQGATVQSGRLANAMSNDIFGGRQLGENKTIEVPSSVIWLFTGNGIKFVGDFATRIYPITINPNMADPNTRIFKRENIGQWAMDNRKHIISALLSIIISGKDMLPLGGSTRFQLWDKFVRRPLFKASGIDVNEAVKNNQKDDPLQLVKTNLLIQLYEIFVSKEFTTREVIKAAFGTFESEETELGVAITDLLGNKAKNSLSLGRHLSSMVDIILGNLSLKRRGSNVVYWQIINNKDKS